MDSFPFAINQFFYTLALIAWLGCDFMSMLSTQVIFKLASSREVAGNLNGELLKRLDLVKYTSVGIVGSTSIFRYLEWDEKSATDLTRLALLAIMAGAALLSAAVISPLTRRARAAARSQWSGNVQSNVAFRGLHGASMLLLVIEMAAGISVWFFN